MIALYSRVSTAEQATEGYSIGEQTERMTKYCEAMGWRDFHHYSDPGFSGGNTDRPALQSLLRDVRSGLVSKVVVYKLDRLSRSQKDTLELIEDEFLANGVDFVSMSERFDTSTPFGRAIIGILAVFAQLEREQIKERTHLGRESRAKQGKYHGGGAAPIGYDYVNGELLVNEFEAWQVQEIHRLYQSGMSMRGIAKDLRARGIAHRSGNWSETMIRKVLGSDLYTGVITFAGEKHRGTHTPIITEDTLRATQRRLFSTPSTTYQGRKTLLGGLLWCRRCGARYAAHQSTTGGKTYRYYSCQSRTKSHLGSVRGECDNRYWRVEELEALVLGEIKKLALDPTAAAPTDHRRDDLIKKEISRLEAQRSRLIDLYGVGDITIDEVQERILPLTEQRKRLEAELVTPVDVPAILSDFAAVCDAADTDQLRSIIQALIERIEIDGDDVIIRWRF